MNAALEGVLAQALEEALVGVYERDQEMFDIDGIPAIETLAEAWQPGDVASDPEALSYWAYAAFEAMRAVCESYAGRDIPYDVDNVAGFPYTHEDDAPREILSAEKITAVLLQLHRSIETWQERGGFRGFYVSIRA